jgi:hypothetical protein
MLNDRAIRDGGSTRPDDRTESGELERPEMKRRKIDCGTDQGDRRQLPRGGDRRNTGFARPPSPES